jgi:hypothetical protein
MRPQTLVPFVLIGLLLIGFAGCIVGVSRSKTPPVAAGAQGVRAASRPTAPTAWPQPGGQALYQQRTAEQWADSLLRSKDNAEMRYRAAKALETLGAAATPYLVKALQDKDTPPQVRVAAMEALTPAGMAKHEKQLVETLLDSLKDPNAAVREQAAARLAWFDRTTAQRPESGYMAQERLSALQTTYYCDTDENVRLAARNSLLSVYDHMRGRFDCPPVQDIFIGKPGSPAIGKAPARGD